MNGAVKQDVKPVITDAELNHGRQSLEENGKNGPAAGLCTTCHNHETCDFNRSGKVVLNCSELDYPGPQACRSTGERLSLAPARRDTPQSGTTPGVFLGLCATCDIKEGCTFPKPEGGVWNCEEFV